jgi:serine/threonine-protein kinase
VLAPVPPIRRAAPRWTWAAAAAVAAALAALLVWQPAVPPPGGPPGPKQVAVLPFTNVGGEATTQALADGLAEVLTTRLTQLERFSGGLQVVPAVEVRQQRVTSVTEARRAFGVNVVVSGSLQRTADGLRLTLNVIDGVTLRQVRGDAIDVPHQDAAALQDDVVVRLARLLDIPMTPDAQAMVSAGGTGSPGAYEFYLQGRGYLQRSDRAENLDIALHLLGRALGEDRGYALAHAALAEAAWRKYEATKEAVWVTRAREAGTEALRLSPSLGQGQVTMAIIDIGTGRYEEAVTTLSAVLERDPSNADAYRELGRAHEALGDYARAEATLRQAVTARPGDWNAYNSLGGFYFRRQRFADAATAFDRVVALTPDNARGYTNLGGAYLQLRQWEPAMRALEKATSLSPTGPRWSNLATAYFRQRRYADAAKAYERAIELDPKNDQVWYNLASAYLWVPEAGGRSRAAFERAASLGEDARKVNPRDASLLARLANTYAHLGDRDRARARAGEAEKLAPKDARVFLLTAQAHEAIGDRRQALARVAAALEHGLAPEDIEGTRSLDRLREDEAYRALRAAAAAR